MVGPCGPQNGPLVGAEACGDECTLSKLPGAVPVAYKVTYTPPPEPSQVRAMLTSIPRDFLAESQINANDDLLFQHIMLHSCHPCQSGGQWADVLWHQGMAC